MSYVKVLIAAAVLVTVGLPSVRADLVLWYNGDFNGVNGLANESNTGVPDARVYDNFHLSSNQVITSVFSNNLMNFGATTANWEIRSGVSAGNGGTLIASGIAALCTQALTGRSGFGFDEYTITVSGLNVALSAGTYWLEVNPIDSGSGRSFISTTSNANGVGAFLPDGSFFNSAFFGQNFQPASGQVGAPADFSMGVAGHDQVGAPAPAGVQLGAIGAAVALATYSIRRLRARRKLAVV